VKIRLSLTWGLKEVGFFPEARNEDSRLGMKNSIWTEQRSVRSSLTHDKSPEGQGQRKRVGQFYNIHLPQSYLFWKVLLYFFH